jgi:predicted glycosyltransferase involved in capsule biosynthesis
LGSIYREGKIKIKMLKFINLYDYAIGKKVDQKWVLESAKKNLQKSSAELSIIIPVYGRESFLEPLIHYFRIAEKNSGLDIAYTIVEHSEVPVHLRTCIRLGINHIWIEKKESDPFNKCLAMNIGACAVKGNDYMFHDLDCLVRSDFFTNLYENVKAKDAEAIQTFSDRRVLYLNADLTYEALMMELKVDDLIEGPIDTKDPKHTGVTPPKNVGAPGGSIWIRKERFLEVGGYDPNIFFGYSPEDIFFWNKVATVTEMHTCTDPRNEIFHMKHPLTHASNPFLKDLSALHEVYAVNCDHSERLRFLHLQKTFLMEAYE